MLAQRCICRFTPPTGDHKGSPPSHPTVPTGSSIEALIDVNWAALATAQNNEIRSRRALLFRSFLCILAFCLGGSFCRCWLGSLAYLRRCHCDIRLYCLGDC